MPDNLEPRLAAPLDDRSFQHMQDRWEWATSEGDARAYRLRCLEIAAVMFRDVGGASALRDGPWTTAVLNNRDRMHAAASEIIEAAERLTHFTLTGTDPTTED